MQQTTSTILMIRPAGFGFNAQTAKNNAFQGSLDMSAAKVQEQAVAEFDAFVDKLKSHGVDVIVVQDTPQPVRPDAVFSNNWICTMPDGTLHLFPMYAPVRRLERRQDIVELLANYFDISEISDWSGYEAKNEFLEGTGSLIFDHVNKLAFACLSPRTEAGIVVEFCEKVGYEAVLFTSNDEAGRPIYHTNVMLHIGADYAVICLESIASNEEREHLISSLSLGGKAIVDISLRQVHDYAGNMLQVNSRQGEKLTIMSRKALQSLDGAQRAIIEKSSTIVAMDIPVIETIGGGSARCMVTEVFLARDGAESFLY